MNIQTINPATEIPIKTYEFYDQAKIEECIAQGFDAFLQWKATPLKQRLKAIARLGELLLENKVALAEIATLEMGKPIHLAIAEVEKCSVLCQHYVNFAQQYLSEYFVINHGKKAKVCYQPLGMILGIMPWNFPFWQALRFAIPTITAGNAVMVKPAPITTGCGIALADLFLKAGFPKHLYQNIIVDNEGAAAIIANEHVAGVSLTGSERAGREVGALAGTHLKKCVLELGGSDPYVVLEDADLELAAQSIVSSRLSNSGQVCIACKRVIVDKKVHDALVSQIIVEMKKYPMGDPAMLETKLGPLARNDLRTHLNDQVQKSLKQGAKLQVGGIIPAGKGFYYPPTLLTDVKPGMVAFDEELFGPVISVSIANDEAHAIELANMSSFGLGAAVFTKDLVKGEFIATEQLDAGTCYVNSMVVSDPELPFGGIKHSGHGRELAKEGLLEFVNIKAINVSL